MPPDGTGRVSLSHEKTPPSPRLHQSLSELTVNFDYAGSRKFLEYEVESWIRGTPDPKPHRSKNVIYGPNQTYRISIKDGALKGKKTYEFHQDFKEVKRWGGGVTQGGAFSLYAPEDSPKWVATMLPAVSIDVPDGEKPAIWGLLLNREKLDLPAGSSLDAWAAKADAAFLFRIKLSD